MSPFAFAEISRSQGRGKDKLSGKKVVGKRDTRKEIFVYSVTQLFFSFYRREELDTE